VPISAPKAIAPDLPILTSSTGTSYYVQQRTALFARVALACSLAGLVIRLLSDLVKGHPERISPSVYVCFAISAFLFASLWLFARGTPRRLPTLRLIEIVTISAGLLVASFGFRLSTPGLLVSAISFGRAHPDFMSNTDPALVRVLFEFASMLISLLVATQILAVRAALVPSSLKHSLILAAVVGFPICIFTGIGWPAMLPPNFTFVRDDRGFLVVFGANWWLFTGAACGVIARVVHRLQFEVQVAKRLGQYELGEKIGEGGMGVVYRARHAMMKRPVAIKLLPAQAAGQEAIARFEREVQLTSELSHPNTVVIHDYGRTHEGVFYYVMELIEGATLEQVSVAAGPMPSGRVIHILKMVAGALGEAHEHGLVHRDIKPSNILLGPRGGEPDVAKVLDFGLVRAIHNQSEVTNVNAMLGTPQFMSPEAMKSPDRVDGRSDLYSLGAVAYYLLSGCHVFESETAVEVCVQHIHATPRLLSELVSGIDPELEKVVLHCLAKNPDDRPSSARALIDALSRCPSNGQWTSDMARAWWTIHERLIHPQDPSKTFFTGEVHGVAGNTTCPQFNSSSPPCGNQP
jgi:serine/threonine protein kinase